MKKLKILSAIILIVCILVLGFFQVVQAEESKNNCNLLESSDNVVLQNDSDGILIQVQSYDSGYNWGDIVYLTDC